MKILILLALVANLFCSCAAAPLPSVLVSVPDQRLYVFSGSHLQTSFPASTSRFGLGDQPGRHGTPLGLLRICEKLGTGARLGSVFQHRHLTGEVVRPNAPRRNCIVTRILRLAGLEAGNRHTEDRGVYIHGTTCEAKVGTVKMSYGCVGLKSQDVVRLFDEVEVGTSVMIVNQTLSEVTRHRWRATILAFL